ncbi:MAG: Thymidylate kinase (EC [uncultured Thiotrichaceae bacterium]|uniref:Thymidylate kinase n=1 Tax=uncultured Thiotrichaceae bacterium TaxID=298394 RepID=A0A6S6SRR1_9GAMM|nr:MAG: Thymidylate kinase (EC [uncultured Thiotrichaceae bacterium]
MAHTARGCFITLEGGEGAGKTTHVQSTADYLRQQGIDVITTREPGGTAVSEAIRAVLLNPDLPDMHADTELLLMFAARNEHLQRKIIPALEQGQWVICDRFTDATYAYQGYGRGLLLERIAELERWVQGELRPDCTLLFDLDVEIGMQRVRQRSVDQAVGIDRFEREQAAFFNKIREGYLMRAQASAGRFHKLDAAQPVEKVRQAIIEVLDTVLQQWRQA